MTTLLGMVTTFEQPERIQISIPAGYETSKQLEQLNVKVMEASSPNKALKLLYSGRVNVSISGCEFIGYPEHIAKHPIPLSSQLGFLIFSERFYIQHPKVAQALWLNLAQIDIPKIYRKYTTNQ